MNFFFEYTNYIINELLFNYLERLLNATLPLELLSQYFLNRQSVSSVNLNYYIDIYEFILVFVLLIFSHFITKALLFHIPKKYLEEKNIYIKNSILLVFNISFSLILILTFNNLLIIFLLFVFLNLVIPLFIIDLKIGYLPDVLTYPLLWLGLLSQIWRPNGNIVSAIYAVILSFTVMVVMTTLIEKIKKRPQMGRGDFKLIAACAAWLGVLQLPYFLALSALFGLMQYSIVYLKNKHKSIVSIPFGPAIIISASFWLYLSLINHSLALQLFIS
ncbi:prepilin peptidase [Providencia heimbachae]|uniref:Type IV leader peptidase n=1 Tax=Providencia heimbachae ATCC 35613 TaxID=1354272 RepID=A0A1B7JPF5_9GAMM|nr:A24 family peptidase [Providencia heimbachae]OAT49799.1 type IV leader peptidase [Providencia heimbachae ATCC 35613]SQH12190.1 Pectic enzymes secretion protein outO [Providencia heimbachae]